MFHAVFERQARRSFELVNQHDYDSILASVTPDIYHRFSGDHALAGDRHDRPTCACGSSACTASCPDSP